MRKLAIWLLLLFMAATASAADIFPSIPKKMIVSTHRLCVSYIEKKREIFEHGAAVAIDLSKYGIVKKNILLTAAHCVEHVTSDDNMIIEIKAPGKSPIWTRAKVVTKDEQMDIAVIMTQAEMPDAIELGLDETEIGEAVIAIGSPRGEALAATLGYLSDKGVDNANKKERNFWEASMAIYHGNSGGGLFDANRGKLIGIVTAVVVDDDGKTSAPNIARFVGTEQMRAFVDENIKAIKSASSSDPSWSKDSPLPN